MKQIKLLLQNFQFTLEVGFVSEFSEDEIIIMRTIKTVKRATSENLARELGEPYTPQDLSGYLGTLEKRKLLKKVQDNPSTYELSPLGLVAIGAIPESAKKAFVSVSPEKCFFFYTGIGPDKFTKISACNLSEFRDRISDVDTKSLEFHVSRGDIEKWLRDVLGEAELAREIERLKPMRLQGEALRTRISRLFGSRIDRLTSETSRMNV
jgi:hypothetical protein